MGHSGRIVNGMFLWMMLIGICLAAGVVVALAASTPAAKGNQAKGNIALGKKVYADQNCGMCHTVNGTKKPPFELINTGGMHSRAWLKQKIVNPKATNPKSTMPAYKLPPKELEALTDYMVSLKKPAGKPKSLNTTRK